MQPQFESDMDFISMLFEKNMLIYFNRIFKNKIDLNL